MKILSRYFLREFFKYFIVVLLTITASLLVIEFFDKVDEFYAKSTPIYPALQYFLLQIPRAVLFASPVASLLSILFVIGIAAKWRETVAVQASGGKPEKTVFIFSYSGNYNYFARLIAR